MPASFPFPLDSIFGFLLVLARVSGIFIFVPLPGVKSGPEITRVVLSLGITLSLFSFWPQVAGLEQSPGRLAGYICLEAALGKAIGLAMAFLMEGLQIAAQIAGLQAGYGYASAVDPTSQADSSVLLIFAQLTGGLLFFALGLDREVLRIFAASLQAWPVGKVFLSPKLAENVLRLGSGMFTMGVRLALPVIALLLLVDLALALIGRLNAQLQPITLAFPIKILASLAIIGWMMSVYPKVFASGASGIRGAIG